ncbi:MAG: rhomboid family intramembrane serine protease [Spirochaetes bacterium]|nr:rhomboid family intramembrane serine protease [Spirochaetota bacterium]MBU1080340.1 rhomboid family intramembrane serine protease [Spirochaetota bacterium]
MTIRYNAPTTLTFTLLCAAVLALNTIFGGLTAEWFSVPGRGGFDSHSIRDYVRLFSHIFGHADINHFLSNFSFILLLGPILEHTYGSGGMSIMIAITAIVTGLLNILLFPTGLMGASGIVFMMILLASFTNFNKGELPLTFILVLLLYLGKEVFNAFKANNISEFGHIIGGLCGSIFGYLRPSKR